MRVFIEIAENLTSSIRFIIGTLVLGGMAIGLMMSVAASVVVPKVADSVAERAERIGEKAIIADQEQRRAEQLAKEGWGYKSSSAASSRRDRSSFDAADGGWGN